MDFVLLIFVSINFLKGLKKGFLTAFFTFVGIFLAIVIAWKFTNVVSDYMKNLIGDGVANFLKNILDSLSDEKFSNMEDVKIFISNQNYGNIFVFIFDKLLDSISFEGKLTIGEIFAPSLTSLFTKITTFAMLFVLICLVVNVVIRILSKFNKNFCFQSGNKILGGLMGLFKGLVLFSIFYIIISLLSNVLLNENLLNFATSGRISNYIYENYTKKIISLFY